MTFRLHIWISGLLSLALVAFALAACGGGSSPFAGDSIVLGGRQGRPDVPIPVGPAPRKLEVVDLKKGEGPAARVGDELSVRYFSLAYKSHQIHEDNWSERFGPFVLGEGQLLEAWERGLVGVRVGDLRELIVPGDRETQGSDAELYIVETLSVKREKRRQEPAVAIERVEPTGSKPNIAVDLGKPPTRLVVRELKKGTGAKIGLGSTIGARFIDINYKTGRIQDFWGDGDSGEAPYQFGLGQNAVRKGWEMVLPGKRLGTRLELLLPSRLAYGDGPMRYVVEIIESKEIVPARRR